MNRKLQILKSKIYSFLKENIETPLYVEYLSQMSNENPFIKQGKKWEFVWAKYPDGRRDIGVYSFSEDLVYAYQPWRKMVGIDKDGQEIGASMYDRHFKSDYKSGLNEDKYPMTIDDVEPELDFSDEPTTEPDYENDAFIQDVVSGGYDVSVSGKHIGHYDEMNVALYNLKKETERSNYFPTIWFVSDHGNYWPIDENGNEIKNSLTEIVTGENPFFDTDPSDGDIDHDKSMKYGANEYYNKGLEAFKNGDLENSQKYYKQALDFGSWLGWTEKEFPPYNTLAERISPDLFKSAIDVSKERGTDNRTRKLGTLYFNDFIGKPLMGGIISNIVVAFPQQSNYKNVRIEIEKESNIEPGKTKKSYITYDIYGDLFDIEQDMDRKDARILSLIALKINPDSRYKETGKYFSIKGMNEEVIKENLDMQFPELNGMKRYQLEKEFNKTTDEISNLRNKYRDFVPEEINVLKLKQDKIYKLLYGDDPTGFENVGQHLKENFERNKAIASTIINQLGGMGKLNAMTGAYNFVAVDYGVSFKIKNPRANYIKIVVNGKDYYDVEIGRIRGTDYKVLVKEEDVPVENLKSLIEKSTGMYLSLFENTVLDTQTELESEIENRFRPSDDMLSYSDMQDIASEYGVDFEDVLQITQAIAGKRHKERKSDLTYWVKELITQYEYEHNDEIPDWNIFYNSWKQEGFQEENFWANEQDVRTEYLKQTSDPNQLSLFERNLSIKKLIENEISQEDNYRNKLEELKSEGKITLSIGQHGMIFMQITGIGFMKSYNNYREAYQHYLKSTGVVAEGEYGFDDDFDEGPQPGDAEYHYDMGHKKSNNGRDIFSDIDWKVLWECLIANREALANGGRLPDNPNFIMYNVGDFTGDDGFLSLDSLNHLENYDLIENNGTYPIIGEDYLDFDKFYNKAKEIWLKDTKINNDPPHEPEPYRSGNEDSML